MNGSRRTSWRRFSSLGLGAVIGFTGGCSEGAHSAATTLTERDSAGITIVEIPAAALEDLPELTLAPTPDLSIGVIEGEEPYMLLAPRYTRTLAGDTILVVNGRPGSLRWYAPDGTFLRQAGRSGEGPGEYQSISGLVVHPDGSMLIWDPRLRRVTTLERGGGLRDTWPVLHQGLNESFLGAFSDGSIMVHEMWLTTQSRDANRNYLTRIAAGGDQVDTLRVTPRNVKEIMWFGSPSFEEQHFEPSASHAVDADAIWRADGRSWEVRQLDRDGQPLRILRPLVPRRTLSSDQFEHWADSNAFQGPWPVHEREEIRRISDRRGYSDSIPWVSDVEIGTGGRIWLAQYPFPGVVEDRRWLVLEPDGAPVAWVSAPRHFRPWEFGDDYLLGVGRDELDVQYVQRYPLVASGG